MTSALNPARACLSWADGLRAYRVFDRPVFVISPPRSGSTLLFDLVCRLDGVWASDVETDDVWWDVFPYGRTGDPSDLVDAGDLTPATARKIRRGLYRHTLWSRERRDLPCGVRQAIGVARVRYVDKTIANCFHLEFLRGAFPDALYVLLVRDGRATVSSMMEGWLDPRRFVKNGLEPYIGEGPIRIPHWSYPAPPGWRDHLDEPLEEVCAWSWCEHVGWALRGLDGVAEHRRMTLRYEDLVASPGGVLERVATFSGLPWTDRVAASLDNIPQSRTTVSAPEHDKWKRLHPRSIDQILPRIGGFMRRLEYDL